MPIQGLKYTIAAGGEQHQSFQATGSFTAYNPNDGYALIALDRTATTLDYDHKLPSQSGGHFPGPVNSYLSIRYVDQSGGGLPGQVIVYPSPQTLQIPQFWSIGRAIQTQATTLDIIEGTQPPVPATGTCRMWADVNGLIHHIHSDGTDTILPDKLQNGCILSYMLALPVDVAGFIRSSGTTGGAPLSGAGIELLNNAGTATLQGFNRSSSAYMPTQVVGSTVTISSQSGGRVILSPNGTGSVVITNQDRYTFALNSNVGIPTSGWSTMLAASSTVPDGIYLVMAQVTIQNNGSQAWNCGLLVQESNGNNWAFGNILVPVGAQSSCAMIGYSVYIGSPQTMQIQTYCQAPANVLSMIGVNFPGASGVTKISLLRIA